MTVLVIVIVTPAELRRIEHEALVVAMVSMVRPSETRRRDVLAVLMMMEDRGRILERLKREPQILALRRMKLLKLEAGAPGGHRLVAGDDGEERLDRVGDGVGVERRRQKIRIRTGTRTICWLWCRLGFLRDRIPGRKVIELIYGVLGLLDEPIDGLARAIVAEAVLNVVELNGRVGGESDSAVPGTFGGAHFAVPVFSSGGPYNVASLDLHYLSAAHPPRRRELR